MVDANFTQEEDKPFAFLRKESLDLFNRLHSIEEDITFVEKVRQTYSDLPILPNLRCGAWYTDPRIHKDIPVYFKSTDGHFGNWSFNLRRPNIHLLSLLLEHKGVILVDSTRSGKRIPDALSKTVPIWCAVINGAVIRRHPDVAQSYNFCPINWNTLFTHPGAVSLQEHSQIESRLEEWIVSLANSSYILPRLPYPLRPIWVTPSTTTFPILPSGKEDMYLAVVCISASKQVQEGLERRTSGFTYIQGSGDDHELWGMGLTPETFWTHRSDLLNADRSSLALLVPSLVSASHIHMSPNCWFSAPTPIRKVSGRILLSSIADLTVSNVEVESEDKTAYIIITSNISKEDQGHSIHNNLLGRGEEALQIITPEGKKGQIHFLKTVLPNSMAYIAPHLSAGARICVCCDTGKDLSVGVALAALQRFFNDKGEYIKTAEQRFAVDYHPPEKQSIRTKLEWIISSCPQANPSRTTLKRVNEFLLSSSSFRS